MKNSNIIKPTGLKGNDKLNRMRELMGAAPINEGITRSVVELTKEGPDGNVYAIVRENHEYFIKISKKKPNLVVEDFQYIGGLQNKKDKVYPSYAKALKQLNLKFMSLNEAIGKSGQINVFVDDNLITEHHPYKADQKLSATKGMGDGAEYIVDKKGKELSYDAKEGKEEDGFGDNIADSTAEKDVEKVKLSENELAIDEMITGEEPFTTHGHYTVSNAGGYEIMLSDSGDAAKVRDAFGSDNPETSDWLEIEYVPNEDGEVEPVIDPQGYNIPLNMVMRSGLRETKKGFSIARAIQEMDEVIDSITTKESKIDSILESLGEEERAIMIEALKKKV